MATRPLNQQEINILKELLSQPFPGNNELRVQVNSCTVRPTGDSDNYGSVYLIPELSRIFQRQNYFRLPTGM